MNNDIKILSDINCEMRLENFQDRSLISRDKAIISYKIDNQRILLQDKGSEKYTFCIVIIEYNGVKHYSHFAYDRKDVLYFKENNISPEIVISKMINIILETTNIPRDQIDTDNLEEFVNEFKKYTKKLIK